MVDLLSWQIDMIRSIVRNEDKKIMDHVKHLVRSIGCAFSSVTEVEVKQEAFKEFDDFKGEVFAWW